jgi:hypothetical protein
MPKTKKTTTGTVPGRVDARAARALERRERAIAINVKKGMTEAAATKKVDAEIKENVRGDRRNG